MRGDAIVIAARLLRDAKCHTTSPAEGASLGGGTISSESNLRGGTRSTRSQAEGWPQFGCQIGCRQGRARIELRWYLIGLVRRRLQWAGACIDGWHHLRVWVDPGADLFSMLEGLVIAI